MYLIFKIWLISLFDQSQKTVKSGQVMMTLCLALLMKQHTCECVHSPSFVLGHKAWLLSFCIVYEVCMFNLSERWINHTPHQLKVSHWWDIMEKCSQEHYQLGTSKIIWTILVIIATVYHSLVHSHIHGSLFPPHKQTKSPFGKWLWH